MDFDRDAVFPNPQEDGTRGAPAHAPGYSAQPAAQAPAGYPSAPGPTPGYPTPGYPTPGYPAAQPPQATRPATTYGRCVLASLVWVGVVLVALLVALFAAEGPPGSGEAVGLVVGRMVLPCLVSAWLVHRFFRHKRMAFWLLALASLPTFVVSFVVLGAISLAGQR